MSDIKKFINIVSETTAGATSSGGFAAVPSNLGEVNKRVEEDNKAPDTPEIIEYGNWENSALSTGEKLKKKRHKAAKIVKSVYGEDMSAKTKKSVKESSSEMPTRRGFLKGMAAAALGATGLGAAGSASARGNPRWSKIVDDAMPLLEKGLTPQQVAKLLDIEVPPGRPMSGPMGGDYGAILYALQQLQEKQKNSKLLQNLDEETEITEQDLIINPNSISKKTIGFIPKDHDRTDHEVSMSKSDLYHAGKDAVAIFALIKDISEEQGLEGWVQSKITIAADYLNTVREYLEGKQLESASNVFYDSDKPAEPWNTIRRLAGHQTESADLESQHKLLAKLGDVEVYSTPASSEGSVVSIRKNGKEIAQGDFDRWAHTYFVFDPISKHDKSFDTAKEIAAHFASDSNNHGAKTESMDGVSQSTKMFASENKKNKK